MKKTILFQTIIVAILLIAEFVLSYLHLPSKIILVFGLLILIAVTIFNLFKRTNKLKKILIGLSGLIIYIVCSFAIINLKSKKDIPIKVTYQSYNWSKSTPETEGLNASAIAKLVEQAKKYEFINALGIIKNRHLIVEEYFNEYSSGRAFPMASATKGIVSALTGIAIEKELIDSVNQKIIDFFPEYKTKIKDSRKQDISIEHILSMRAGYEYNSGRYNRSNNLAQYLIVDAPLTCSVDEKWAYNGSSSHLLSAMIAKKSNMSTKAFADEYLCKPLGITVAKWDQDPAGINFGGGGIYMTLRDAGRFGQLYLDNGVANGDTIISSNWIKQSLKSKSTFKDFLSDNMQYGYLWWIDTIDNRFTYHSSGHGGQFIVNVPDCDMCIVVFADKNVPNSKVEGNMQKIYSIIKDIVESSELKN